ncbi:MAG: lipopolysaccharide core heptose(II) kinase RfaY [Fusobacteriaceae bacterium]
MKKKICIEKKKINIYYENEEHISYYEKIRTEDFIILKVLKNDHRSKVLLIKILDNKIVYKVPYEKNTNKWQRFLSIFRGSESKREFNICKKLEKLELLGPTPILAAETLSYFRKVESFFLMSYIEGENVTANDAELVSNMLKKIHYKGYLHGDSQLSNFILSKTSVYIIDCKLSKNIFGRVKELQEFIYLEKSCYRTLDTYDKKSFLYFIVKKNDKIKDDFNFFMKKIRRKK